MADFSGFSPSPEITRLITEQHLGGVLLFQKNIESPAQVARLCRELQDLARQAGSPPLLIAVDQEGGPVDGVPLGAPGMERLEAVEFLPFRHAIREGLGALMTAHIAFTAFGSIPATLSPPVLEGMLRRAWGFDGVVFTDSFAMAPIKEHVGAGPAAVLALLAGADVLLALGGSDLQREVFASVRRAAEQGVLSVQRLRQSFERVQRLRPRMTPPGPPAGAEAGG